MVLTGPLHWPSSLACDELKAVAPNTALELNPSTRHMWPT